MSASEIEISVLGSLEEIDQEVWDSCACPESSDGGRPIDPFTTHRFLSALERSGSVGVGSGWQSRHLVARADGEVIAVAPLYAKSHSQGEYIFDHNWAHAWERAGGRYYPKLQVAVPFTPATGRRFLSHPDFQETGISSLVHGLLHLALENHLSSAHVTFCTEQEAEIGAKMGLLHRVTQQYHWANNDYEDFDGFLAALSSRKRKTIRRERRRAQDFGGQIIAFTGDEIVPEHWDAFWRFYQDTGARKWGTPYLTRSFFEEAHQTMRDDMLLVLAFQDDRPIAGALNFIGRKTLFGRYWGAVEHYDCLHFEVCYYHAIQYAIENGLASVEAGAQGEHKLARGYLPVETHSLHWIADDGFSTAIEQYLEAERRAVTDDIEVLTSFGPFRKLNEEPT